VAWTLEQVRTHNLVNEITGITEGEGQSAWVVPTYDARGDMTSGPKPGFETTRQHFAYDAWNRMTEVKADDDGDPGATVVTYRYDGTTKRIQKLLGSDPENPDQMLDFYYSGRQVVETHKDGDEYEHFVWSLRYVHSPVLRDRDADGQSWNGLEERLYYTNDANFNVTALINTSGAVVERYTYTPYGQVTIRTADWGTRAESAYANDVLFTGHRLDAETGLYYFLMRYYHPTLGRLITWDPIGYTGGINLVEYVGSNPANRTDPTGNEATVTWLESPPKPETIEPKWVEQEEIDKLIPQDPPGRHPGYAWKNVVPDPGSFSLLEGGRCCCWYGDVDVTAYYEYWLSNVLKSGDEKAREYVKEHERAHILEDYSATFRDETMQEPVKEEVATHDTPEEAYKLTETTQQRGGKEVKRPILLKEQCAAECERHLRSMLNAKLDKMRSAMEAKGAARDGPKK